MLGIISALPDEACCLIPRKFLIGQPIKLTENTLLFVSGIGASRAQHAAQQLVASGAKALLSFGTAGGLDPKLNPADIIVPTQILAADGARYLMTPTWQQLLYKEAQGIGPAYQQFTLHSDTTISTTQMKQSLFQDTGAIAVDMETAAIAAVAHQHQLSVACLRVIVDPADFNLPQLIHAVKANGKMQWLTVLWRLIRHPLEWFSILQLAQHFSAARSRLREIGEIGINVSTQGSALLY